MKYDMIPTNDKDDLAKILAYFATLYAMWKAYSEDRTTEIGFDSADNITHIAPEISVHN